VAMRVRDPRELSLPPVGLLTLEDAETGEEVELDTRSARLRRAYEEERAAQDAAWQAAVRRAGIDLVDLRTDRPYLLPLMTFFRNRRRRLAG
ncbi:MAG: DUF58 domain-containing protein, partial [Planctomycetota bacterium]